MNLSVKRFELLIIQQFQKTICGAQTTFSLRQFSLHIQPRQIHLTCQFLRYLRRADEHDPISRQVGCGALYCQIVLTENIGICKDTLDHGEYVVQRPVLLVISAEFGLHKVDAHTVLHHEIHLAVLGGVVVKEVGDLL